MPPARVAPTPPQIAPTPEFGSPSLATPPTPATAPTTPAAPPADAAPQPSAPVVTSTPDLTVLQIPLPDDFFAELRTPTAEPTSAPPQTPEQSTPIPEPTPQPTEAAEPTAAGPEQAATPEPEPEADQDSAIELGSTIIASASGFVSLELDEPCGTRPTVTVDDGAMSTTDLNADPLMVEVNIPDLDTGRHTLTVECEDGEVFTVLIEVFHQTGAKNGVSGAAATTAAALAAAVVLVIGFRQAGRGHPDLDIEL